MVKNTYLALPLMLLLLLASTFGRRCDNFDPPGVCRKRFDLFMEPRCDNGACKNLCDGKNFDRLYGWRCVDDSGCECTYSCPRHH
ncbi:hypothetical protein BVC80_8535g14 [Macleaya cordata]|uniref:Uncharacterized protein n=1 Tax=Macleaya cordata TaxID=56857 RepID=A0A200PQB0_MACCD|nr:hypothetical protein BVC80_8535g14 [Macleaya cordata]